jgi:flavin reductase
MKHENFREAMSRLGTAVNLVTTDGPAGRYGFTASAVCSVTDSPPSLLVCINRGSTSYERFRINGVLCVNVLAARHQSLSRRFASKADAADRFSAGEWAKLGTGAPVLADAAVALDCRIVSVTTVGTHGVFLCEVTETLLGFASEGLIYFNRAYHPVGLTTRSAS